MYLQQYCAGAALAKPPHSVEPSQSAIKKEKPKKNGDSKPAQQNVKRKEKGSLLDSPLDLSTRTLESEQTPENLSMSIKDGLYPPQFPFASLQQMLLQSNRTQEQKSPSSPPPVVVKTEKKLPPKPSPPPCSSPCSTNIDGKKDLSYVCPICGQMFSLHDRYVGDCGQFHFNLILFLQTCKAHGKQTQIQTCRVIKQGKQLGLRKVFKYR